MSMTSSPVNALPNALIALLQQAVAQSIEQAVDLARLNLQIQTGAVTGGTPNVAASEPGVGEIIDILV